MLYQTVFVLTVRMTLYLIRHDQFFQHISVRSKPTELLAHCSLLAYSKCGLISTFRMYSNLSFSRMDGNDVGGAGDKSLDSLNFYGKFSLFLFIFIFSFS